MKCNTHRVACRFLCTFAFSSLIVAASEGEDLIMAPSLLLNIDHEKGYNVQLLSNSMMRFLGHLWCYEKSTFDLTTIQFSRLLNF